MSKRRFAPGCGDEPEKAVFSGGFELTRGLELPQRPTTAAGKPYDEARLLVRIEGEPVGFITVALGTKPLDKAAISQAIKRDLDVLVEAELARQRHPGWQSLNGKDAAQTSHRLPDGEQDAAETSHQLPGVEQDAAQTSHRLPGVEQNAAETSHQLPGVEQDAAQTSHRLPSVEQDAAETSHQLPGAEQVSVSVVVCTRNRAQALPDCLDSLKRLEHDELDFIIVDNAPVDDSTRDVVMKMADEDSRFQYVREMLPGLSHARNRGLAHTTSEILAYTDDDVRVDPLWIKGLLRGFGRSSSVGCVTGMVASASLELPAEQYFDGRVWWSSSCEAHVYDARSGPAGVALHPYAAGVFGTGANFAVRAALLREIGGFDESLGAGSLCDGGEDLDIFVRFIRAGYSISYEPAALVWHEHRADRDELRRQMYAYGKALSAYLFKYASSRRTALDLLRRAPQGVRHLGVLGARSRRVGSQTGLAYEPVIAEICGLMAGPFAYVRARRAQDPERRRAVAP